MTWLCKLYLKGLTESQTVWIQTRFDKMFSSVCIQTVCKGHQQAKVAGKELNQFMMVFCLTSHPMLKLEIRRPDLGSNCLQQLSADDACRQRLKDDYD